MKPYININSGHVMDIDIDQLNIDFPPDVELLREVLEAGAAIASETTDRYSVMDDLFDKGLLSKMLCPKFGNVFQFEITENGKSLLV